MKFTRMMSLIAKELNKHSDVQIDMALSGKMAQQIDLWSRVFENRASWLNKDVKSCNIAAAVASEIARLVTLELKSEISGSVRADYMQSYYNTLLKGLRRYVEYGCAKGGLILKPYVTEQGISIQYIQADSFFPISFDSSGNITRCVFAEQLRKGQMVYTRLEDHELRQKTLKITNRAYQSTTDAVLGSEIPVQSVSEWSKLEYEVVFSNVKKVPFGYFKIPLANANDSDSPLGCSVYARAIELIKEADHRYSQISWEYESKEAAIHIAEGMLKDDPNNKNQKILPAHKERLYRPLEYSSGAKDKPLLDVFSPDIRSEPLFKGFNEQLRLIEFNCCLAYGTLSDPQNVDKTAEEIKASKQRSYTLVSDTQMALQDALTDLIDAMDFYCSVYDLCPQGEYDISFTWDDSIVVDAEKERLQDMQEVREGLMPKWKYKVKWQGLSEEQAKAELAMDMSVSTGIAFPGDEQESTTQGIVTNDEAEELAGKALNGAQTQSLIAIIQQYASGTLSIGQAVNVLSTAIGVSKEKAKAILEGTM